MNEELRLWTVSEAGEVDPLSPISEMPTELELEDLLVQHPEMLEHDLKVVGRQTPTETGWLDLLAVDRDGRLVVYELKRGTLARDAVTQVLDYASAIDAMSMTDLTKHIAECSGKGGIPKIEDFEQWYLDNFGGVDLSRLLPPRMVLIGLGVDSALERMARFMSGGPVDVSVVTFQGFTCGENRLLARQMEVGPGPKPKKIAKTTKEKRQDLREFLVRNGYKQVFDRVCSDIRKSLPDMGVYEQPGRYGIGFQLPEPDDPSQSRTCIGVYAGHDGSGIFSVSIPEGAIRWGKDALEKLRGSIDLGTWSPGGYSVSFTSEEEWVERWPAVLKFVEAVLANRAAAAARAKVPRT